ncbi:MAG: tripartite tricarboxylate transporter TctB family protein [Burkholderiales bacterium]
MKRAWQIAAAVFAVLFVLWAQQSWRLSLRDTLGPGPGFFPFWLSVIGAALAIVLIAQTRRSADPAPADAAPLLPEDEALGRVLKVLAGLAAATALLDVLGYRIAVAAFCVFLLRALGSRNWWVVGVFAAAASFGVHAVFSDLLKVPLPAGLLGF